MLLNASTLFAHKGMDWKAYYHQTGRIKFPEGSVPNWNTNDHGVNNAEGAIRWQVLLFFGPHFRVCSTTPRRGIRWQVCIFLSGAFFSAIVGASGILQCENPNKCPAHPQLLHFLCFFAASGLPNSITPRGLLSSCSAGNGNGPHFRVCSTEPSHPTFFLAAVLVLATAPTFVFAQPHQASTDHSCIF
jgi:hypothetical protein